MYHIENKCIIYANALLTIYVTQKALSFFNSLKSIYLTEISIEACRGDMKSFLFPFNC